MYFLGTIILWMLALIIGSGKANFLIAGYNTASKEEKEKIDHKKLSKFMGKFLFLLGTIQLVYPISEILNIKIEGLHLTVSIVFFLITLGGVIYMNTSKFEK